VSGRRSIGPGFIDLIRDGVPGLGDTYGAEYDLLVRQALNSTALSAIYAGWDYAQWTYLLDEAASHLGIQARRVGGKRERDRRSLNRLRGSVWDSAVKYRAEHELPTAEEIAACIATMRQLAADADHPLSDNMRTVLADVCDTAERLGTIRPAVSFKDLVERTGLTRKAARYALDRLHVDGLLTRERPGDLHKRKAALRRLRPPAERTRGTYTRKTELRAPTAKSYVPQPAQPAKSYVPHPVPQTATAPHRQEEPPVTPHEVAAIVAATVEAVMQPHFDRVQAQVDRIDARLPDQPLAKVRHLHIVRDEDGDQS
jgi:hypothetical protein